MDTKLFPAEWGQELNRHTIAAVETFMIRSRYPRLMGLAGKDGEWGYGKLMKVYCLRTQTGYEGWGLVSPTAGDGSTLLGKTLGSLVIPGDGVKSEARFAEFPLLDLAGRLLSLPAFRLLGLLQNLTLPCYDGSVLMQDLVPQTSPGGARAMLDAVSADWDAGYRTFRLAMGRGLHALPEEEGLLRDAAILQLLQTHFPSAGFMVDFPTHNALYLEHFLQVTQGMPLVWVEVPLKEDREGFTALRETVARTHPEARLAASQSAANAEAACRMIQEGLLDGLHPDVTALGLTRLTRLIPRIAESGGFVSPGCYGNPLKALYAAHLAAISPAIHSLEGVNASLEGVSPEAFPPLHGEFLLPESPGFGAEFIWGMKGARSSN